MQGPNLVLIGSDQASVKNLISELDILRGEFQNLRTTACSPSQIAEQIEGGAQGVLIDLQVWSQSDEMTILGLRGKGYVGPILILGELEKTSTAEAQMAPRDFDKVVFLSKPYDKKSMIGIVRRMVIEPIIAARKFPRHETNERAELHLDGQRTSQPCWVKNMSKGGAYLEFERSVYVRVGDEVTLSIRLGQLDREYALRGRVAWLNSRNAGLGIEFTMVL